MVTAYVPAEPLHDSVEVPEPPTMLVGFRLHVRPVPTDNEWVRSTIPVNPLSGAIVTVEVPVLPSATVTLVGLAEIPKSKGKITMNSTLME